MELTGIEPKEQAVGFKLCKESSQKAVKREILSNVQIGDTITFIYAPAYFYDGYIPPIVALTADDVDYLKYAEGMDDLLKSIK